MGIPCDRVTHHVQKGIVDGNDRGGIRVEGAVTIQDGVGDVDAQHPEGECGEVLVDEVVALHEKTVLKEQALEIPLEWP